MAPVNGVEVTTVDIDGLAGLLLVLLVAAVGFGAGAEAMLTYWGAQIGTVVVTVTVLGLVTVHVLVVGVEELMLMLWITGKNQTNSVTSCNYATHYYHEILPIQTAVRALLYWATEEILKLFVTSSVFKP